MDFKCKKVLVVGLGASGFASAKFLAEKGAIVKVTEKSDGKAVSKYLSALKKLSIDIETGKHTKSFCKDSEIAVVSPGVDLRSPEISKALPGKIEVIGELELASMFCRAPIVAITGTNGKTTTTSLIGKMLSLTGKHVEVCGNIGTPFIERTEALTKDSIAVVEVSSFQLETIKQFKPNVAVLLNITEDHYERHGDLDGYKREKFKIFMNQDKDDWAVLQRCFKDDPLLTNVKSRKDFFDSGKGMVGLKGDAIIANDKSEDPLIIKLEEIPLKGGHNVENVLCSATVAKIMGMQNSVIGEAIRSFKGLEHRFEVFGVYDGVEYIDDSKGTNIDATKRALESLSKKVVLIAGGVDKGGEYRSISPIVKEKVRAMVVIGEAKEKIKSAFESVVPVFEAGSMEEAVKLSREKAKNGDAVLLSPMCSSFDMYNNYKERGRDFRERVKGLAGNSEERSKGKSIKDNQG